MVTVPLKYVHAFKDRFGRMHYYFRRHGKRTPLPGEPLTAAFMAIYNELLSEGSGTGAASPRKAAPGSFDALCIEYYGAAKFKKLRDSTKAEYRRYIELLRAKHGHKPVKLMTTRFIEMVQDEHQDRPRAADSYVEKLKILCRFAVRRGYRPDNPALAVELLGGAGGTYEPWPDAALHKFASEASPMHRRAQGLLLYTGQRSGDARMMQWTKYKDGGIEVVQSKTGEPLWIPAHRNLRALLDDAEREHMMMLHTQHGNAFGATYFGAWFRKEMARLGLGGLQPHGLRKNAVCALLEAGCSEAETASITGQSILMVMHYAKKVNQKRLAKSGMAKRERNT